jgi:hypothetical protein
MGPDEANPSYGLISEMLENPERPKTLTRETATSIVRRTIPAMNNQYGFTILFIADILFSADAPFQN